MAKIELVEIALGYAQQGYCSACGENTRHERAILHYDDGKRDRLWQCQVCKNIHDGKGPDGT